MSAWLQEAPTLVLRRPRARSVALLVLRIARGQGGEALRRLRWLQENVCSSSFGADAPDASRLQATLGFAWRGLQALGVPRPYLRTFARLAPAFAEGAPLRAARLGDSGPSSPTNWRPGFALEAAHVLLTLHGPADDVERIASDLQECWGADEPLACVDAALGQRLGPPGIREGEWVHFGYRDGLTDAVIEEVGRSPHDLPQTRCHRAGEFLLGHENDSGFNRFALETAPRKLRDFFHHGSFAAYRPMHQDVAAFEAFVDAAVQQVVRGAALPVAFSREWVKAKLCGRWPGGEALRPGQRSPVRNDFQLDLVGDAQGRGCPFAAHARRMRPLGIDAHARGRPLLRRGMPYGPADWSDRPESDVDRGLLGLFFCASLEDQFEHLLGQWANRRPLGSPDTGRAKDPLIGMHEDPEADLRLPMNGGAVTLRGLRPWTRTLGTLYAWVPGRTALRQLLQHDYNRPEDDGPWL